MHWRRVLIILALLCTTLILIGIVALKTYDFNRFKPLITRTVYEATGRELTIEGDIDIDIGLSTGISVQKIRLQNSPWGSRPEMLSLDALEVQFSLPSLITGAFIIKQVILKNPDLLIEIGPTGESNLKFNSPGGKSESTPPAVPNVRIDQISIDAGRLGWQDARTNRFLITDLKKLDIVTQQDTAAAHFDIDGHFNQHPFRITGRTVRPLAALHLGEPFDATIQIETLNAYVQLDVKIKDLAEFAGIDVRLDASSPSIENTLERIGISGIPALGPLQLYARLTGDPHQIRLDQIDLKAGQRQTAALKVKGSVGDLLSLSQVDLEIEAGGDDFERFAANLGQSLPVGGVFLLTARCVDAGMRRYRIEDLSVAIGDNDLAADAEIDISAPKPRATVEIKSRHIDLRPLLLPTVAEQPSTSVNSDQQNRQVAHKKEISLFDLFSAVDVSLKMDTRKVLLPKLTLTDLTATAQLTDGRTDITIDGARVPDLEALTTLTHMPELGPFQITGRLEPGDNRLALTDLHIKAGHPHATEVVAKGGIADLLTGRSLALDIQLRGTEAADLARFIVEPWPLKGSYELTGSMQMEDLDLIRFENLAGTLADMPFQGSVRVELAGRAPAVLVTVDSERFNLKPLVLPKIDLPEALQRQDDLGLLKAHLRIVVPEGPVGFENVQIRAGTVDLLELTLTGNVTNVERFLGAKLYLKAQGNELTQLERLVGHRVPVSGPFSMDMDIDVTDTGRYRFNRISAAVGENAIRADATIDTTRKRPLLTARIASDSIDLAAMGTSADKPVSGGTYFSETILKDRLILPQWRRPPAIVAASDADIQAEIAHVIGDQFLIDTLKCRAKSINGKIAISATGKLSPQLETLSNDQNGFEIGPTEVTIKGIADKEILAINAFRLQAGSPDTIAVTAAGSVKDVARQRDLDLMIDLRGNDAAYLNRFVETQKPLAGPFYLTAHLVDPQLRKYRIDQFELAIAGSDLSGTADIDLAAERPRIDATLSSTQFDMRPFIRDTDPEDLTGIPSTPASNRVFPNDPINLTWMDKLDLRISFEGKQFVTPVATGDNLSLKLEMAEGSLTLKPVAFTSGSSAIDSYLTITKKSGPHNAKFGLEIDNIDIGNELAALGRERDLEGLLNAKIDIEGPADSVAAFMGALNGDVSLDVSKGRIKTRYISLIYSDLGSTLLNMMNPFGRKGQFVNLNCFVSNFHIQNGRAENASVLDTPDTTLFVAGKVNLQNERLDVTLKSTPKRGVSVSGIGRIGLSISQFTRPFKLGGTLAAPIMVVDPTQTAFTFGKILGGLALGPYGIALLLTDVSPDNQNPCLKKILEAQEEAQ